jgi:hypothetical protein
LCVLQGSNKTQLWKFYTLRFNWTKVKLSSTAEQMFRGKGAKQKMGEINWNFKLLTDSPDRVARPYIFIPKVQIWMYFGGPWNGKCWQILWVFGIFKAIWYIIHKAIWYILWLFVIFYGHLVYFYGHLAHFALICYIFPVLVCRAYSSGNPGLCAGSVFLGDGKLERVFLLRFRKRPICFLSPEFPIRATGRVCERIAQNVAQPIFRHILIICRSLYNSGLPDFSW